MSFAFWQVCLPDEVVGGVKGTTRGQSSRDEGQGEQEGTRSHPLAWLLCRGSRRVTTVVGRHQVRVCQGTALPSMLVLQVQTGGESVRHGDDGVEEDRQETRRPARRLSREAAAGEGGAGIWERSCEGRIDSTWQPAGSGRQGDRSPGQLGSSF